MASQIEKAKKLILDHKEKNKYFALATSSISGIPNVVPIGFLWIEGDEVRIVDNYLCKSLQNILENPVVAVYAMGGETGKETVQFKGYAKYETSGHEYDAAVKMAHEKNPKYPAKGLVRITVTDVYDTTPGDNAGKRI